MCCFPEFLLIVKRTRGLNNTSLIIFLVYLCQETAIPFAVLTKSYFFLFIKVTEGIFKNWSIFFSQHVCLCRMMTDDTYDNKSSNQLWQATEVVAVFKKWLTLYLISVWVHKQMTFVCFSSTPPRPTAIHQDAVWQCGKCGCVCVCGLWVAMCCLLLQQSECVRGLHTWASKQVWHLKLDNIPGCKTTQTCQTQSRQHHSCVADYDKTHTHIHTHTHADMVTHTS